MAADRMTIISARGTRLLGLVALLGAAALAAHQPGKAGDAPIPARLGADIHYYSTAEPPEDYPGSIPESSPVAPVAGPDSIASLPTAPAAAQPSPYPTAPARTASVDPEVVTASDEVAEEAAPEPVPMPEEDPMRVASATPVDPVPSPIDRVPGTGAALPSPEASSAEVDPIARAKAALAACKTRYESVRDYTCTFIKRERVGGRLSGYEVMAMKARTRPMSVYFKFRQPNAGREAIYVHGRNSGKAIVHDVGIGRLVAGTLHLDPRSRRAMEGNRHPITDAGIGFMIDTLLEGWHREMNPIDSVVTIRDGVLVNKRPSMMIVCTHPERDRSFVFHEVRLYIDREHGLPTRFEAYDWPRRPGEAPPLLEEYTYADLQLNVGLTDHDFDPSNKAYSFGRF